MSAVDSDYKPSSSSSGYSSLGCYNPVNAMQAQAMGNGSQIIPEYSAPGYDALTHGNQPPAGGHFKYGAAYGVSCDQQFNVRACAGCQ